MTRDHNWLPLSRLVSPRCILGAVTFKELYRGIKHNTYGGYGSTVSRRGRTEMAAEDVVDLSTVRKEIATSLLQMELRHEIILGGRKTIKDSHDGMPGKRRPIDRNLLPTIPAHLVAR